MNAENYLGIFDWHKKNNIPNILSNIVRKWEIS